MVDYCTPTDLYDHGLPRGALPNPARLVGSVSAPLDLLTLDQHGLTLGDAVAFRAEAGGALPLPVVEGVTYYAAPTGENHFRIAAALNGPAIDLTTTGSRVLLIVALPITASIAWASRLVDDMLPAHVVPLVAPFPPLVVMTAAELAASRLAAYTGAESRSITELADAARARLVRWGKGVPIRGEGAQPAANLAASSASLAPTDARGWQRFGRL